MATTGPSPIPSEPRRFSIPLPLPLWFGLATIVLIFAPCRADERQLGVAAVDAESSLSPAERELVQLVNAAFTEYEAYYAKAETISDPEEQSKFYQQQDPGHKFVPKLLAFEEQHSGTHVGLMALRRLVLLAAGGGSGENPCYQGRREALKRLPNYLDQPEVPNIIRYLTSGDFESGTEGLLRAISADARGDATIREFSRLTLARWMLHWRDVREVVEARTQELAKGAETESANERRNLEKRLMNVPNTAQMRVWEQDAGKLLRAIAGLTEQLRQPAVKEVDPRGTLIRIDNERTKTMPLISELADGLLFNESHLRTGKPAADLNVALVSGQDWSLSAQRGKVVIIQFSFKGCGPCEAMYPVLQEIQRTYGKHVAILSVMADEKRTDTENAVSEGKITWNVHWDGARGPVATRWAVQSFPKVYLFDINGQLAGPGHGELRGQEVKDKVDQLLK